MLRIGVPVIVGLIASLFIALVFIPLASERLAMGGEKEELKLILWVRRGYMRALHWVLSNRVDALILVLAAMASIQYPMSHLKKTDQQGGKQNDMRVSFEMPSGQKLEKADAFMTSVEDTLLAHKENYNIRSLNTDFNRGWGQIQVIFQDEKYVEWYDVAWNSLLLKIGLRDKPHLSDDEVAQDLKERLEMPPGTRLRLNRGSSGGQQDARLTVNLYGQDTRILTELSKEVVRRLRRVPGLLSVYADIERGGYELQVRLDRDKARRYGVEPQTISGSIAYSLRGFTLSRFQTEDGREVDIRMRSPEGEDRSMQELRTLTFPTNDGKEIPLESMASLFVEPTLGQIRREDRTTMLAVTATANQDDAQALFSHVDQAMQGFEMPRGYRWDKGDRYVRLQESDESQMFAMIMSVTFVFLLMGVLFESFVLPLSVIVSIPFAFLGVYWTLYLTGTPDTIMSKIGSVILIGVVVNNAIVLIDLTNRLRAEGMERFAALIEAGRHRFRPILMTTFTTACGLIPMAIGNSKMIGMPYAPLGRTMMGGLLASTVLTLVLVPLFYTFFDDMRVLVQQVMASAVRSKQPS
jgi:HAE1 family hydrophobic/amphiphilic exporter-1